MRAVVALVVGVIASGCGGGRSSSVSLSTCTRFEHTSGASVHVDGWNAKGVCSAIVRKWSTGGAFWSSRPVPTGDVACRLTDKQQAVTMTVRTGRTFTYTDVGNRLCGALVGSGRWREL